MSVCRQFGIVIDAGSSGSRIQIYSWIHHDVARKHRQQSKLPLNVMPRVETGVPNGGDGWHSRVEPGISSFGSHPAGVDAYLTPLLEHAMSIIPPDKVESTPIFLLATAGMRLLPEDQQQAVLTRACRFIRSRYKFKLGNDTSCATNIRIISGEEEGLFGWVAVNYLMDGFDHHDDDHEAHTSVPDSQNTASTFGFLDMGGASTQIAFEPSPEERTKHADNLTPVRLKHLDGRILEHPVFVTTWLGYGTNKARERYVDAAVFAYKHSSTATADTKGDVIGVEKVQAVIQDPCLPKSLLLSETKHADVMLQGTGNFEACVHRTAPLLNKNAPCLDEPCLFNGVHAPRIDFSVNHFIGISEYWYSTNDVFSMGGIYDFVAFEKSAVQFCAKEWDAIVKAHESGATYKATMDLSRLELQCFKAAWIVNILHEGIGIPRIIDAGGKGDGRNHAQDALDKADDKGFADTDSRGTPSFQSVDQVGDIAISWTLGKMVLEVSQSIDEPASAEKWIGNWPETAINTLVQPKPHHYGPAIIICILLLLIVPKRKAIFTKFRRRNNLDSSYAMLSMEEGSSGTTSSSYHSPNILAKVKDKARTSDIARFILSLDRWRRRVGLRQAAASPANSLPTHSEGSARPRTLRHAASSPTLNTVYDRSSPRTENASMSSDADTPLDRFVHTHMQRQATLKQTQSSSSLASLVSKASNRSRRHQREQSDFVTLHPVAASSESDASSYNGSTDPIQRSSTPSLVNRSRIVTSPMPPHESWRRKDFSLD